MEIGFLPFAPPTARTARGLPMRVARSRYEMVVPWGIFKSSAHTARWKVRSARPKRHVETRELTREVAVELRRHLAKRRCIRMAPGGANLGPSLVSSPGV